MRAGVVGLLVCALAGSGGAQEREDWTPPRLLQPLASFGAARVGGWVYVYSGHTGPTHHHGLEHLSTTFARLNLADGTTWESLPCPLPLQSTVLLADEGQLVRVGGMTATPEGELVSVADVARFDPSTREWTDLPALPEGRSSHGACVFGDRLYVVGGWHLHGDRAPWHEDLLALDLRDPEAEWEELAAPPFSPRRALIMVATTGRLAVLGGMTFEHEFTQEVHLYDPAEDAWSRGPDLPFAGFGPGAYAEGDTVTASGLDAGRARWTVGEDAWSEVGSLIFPRYFHQLVPLGAGRALALGGVTRSDGLHTANAHLCVNERIDEGAEGAQIHRWTLPFPGRAKNRQGVFLHRDSLYVFGGNDSTAQHDFGAEHFLDEGFRIRLPSLRVTPLGPLPVRRQSMRSVVLTDGEAPAGLLVGGFGHSGEGTRAWAEVFRYDFAEDAWVQDGALPRARTQFALLAHEGSHYVFGGLDYDSEREGPAFQFPLEVLRREAGGAFEATEVVLPRPRRAFGGAIVGGKAYLVGGMGPDFSLHEGVDVYDFATGEWAEAPAPSAPRINPHLIALGGKLYLIGGTTPQGDDAFVPNQRVEVFDPATGVWSTCIEELPVSVRHMHMFAWRERILCYSVQHEGEGVVELLVLAPQG